MAKRSKLLMLPGALAVVFLFAGCASVPYTGRSQMIFYSESSDIELGAEAWKETLAKEKKSTDSTSIQALNRVGAHLAAAANRPDYQWEFVVLESTEPNAFALPGGKVAVYSALFTLVDNDAELATVVGHEVSHALARHGVERMSQNIFRNCGGILVEQLFGSQWNEVYNGGTDLIAMLPYSRTQEYEADHLGLILMARAGYDPAAALTFWEKFRKLSQTGTVLEFLSTHPDGDKRLEELKKQLPEAQKYYDEAPEKYGNGNRYR